MPRQKEKNERRIVFDKTKGRCAYCGCELSITYFHTDHIEPKRRYKYEYANNTHMPKGSDDVSNLFPCCQSCNSCKSDLTIEQFRDRIYDRIIRLNRYSSEYQIAKRFGLVTELKINVLFYFEKIKLNG